MREVWTWRDWVSALLLCVVFLPLGLAAIWRHLAGETTKPLI